MAERDRVRREESRRQRLGPGARCCRCGDMGLAALTKTRSGILCYECIAAARGGRTVEYHHPTGRHADPEEVGVPGNLHRQLDEMKDCWPTEVLWNVSGNPLLRVVARRLAERDWARLCADRCQSDADYLIRLNAWLCEERGDEWWKRARLPPLNNRDQDGD